MTLVGDSDIYGGESRKHSRMGGRMVRHFTGSNTARLPNQKLLPPATSLQI